MTMEIGANEDVGVSNMIEFGCDRRRDLSISSWEPITDGNE